MLEQWRPEIDVGDLDELNAKLESMEADDRIKQVAGWFPKERRLASTSGGRDAWVLQDKLREVLGEGAPGIVFVDTNEYRPVTLDNIARMEEAGYDIRRYWCGLSKEEVEERYPDWLAKRGSAKYEEVASLVKHQPLSRALTENQALLWFRRVLRVDAPIRAETPFVRLVNGVYQFSPIADWTREQMEEYKVARNLPSIKGHVDVFKGEDQEGECGIGEKSGLMLPLEGQRADLLWAGKDEE